MNAAKVTLTSTILAATLGLALGLMSAPAAAHDCSRHSDQTHRHCVNEPGTSFEVTLIGLLGPEGGSDVCLGVTQPKLNAQFNLGCSVIIGDLELNLFATSVKTRKNGMTDIQLFFTSGTVFIPPAKDTTYASEGLLATVVLGTFPDFALQLDAGMVDLTKIHQPGKGVMVGPISVGSFFYTPIE